MVKLYEKDEKFIRDHLPNADEVLDTDDLNDVLDALTDWMDINCYNEEWDLTELGREADAVYLSIYQMD